MRTRMYGGVRGRKTKVGGKPTFVFLLLDFKNVPKCVLNVTHLGLLFFLQCLKNEVPMGKEPRLSNWIN